MDRLRGDVDRILRVIAGKPNNLSEEQLEALREGVLRRMESEPPPKIAFIGEAGVGKSTTLNVLFNAGRPVSDTEACTQEAEAIDAHVANGLIRVYDMPGLGESLGKRDKHLATYKRVLENVDVALWVLDAQYRAFESIQRYLSEELAMVNPRLPNRLVFALNKVDLVEPGDWNPYSNQPGEKQGRNIEGRIRDVHRKVREALPKWRGAVVAYSAKRHYGLARLFHGMMEAAPTGRRWLLAHRESLADYLEFVPKEFRPESSAPRLPQTSEERLAEILAEIAPEELDAILREGESSKSFVERLLGRIRH